MMNDKKWFIIGLVILIVLIGIVATYLILKPKIPGLTVPLPTPERELTTEEKVDLLEKISEPNPENKEINRILDELAPPKETLTDEQKVKILDSL
jgi:uncharacterized membrane protein